MNARLQPQEQEEGRPSEDPGMPERLAKSPLPPLGVRIELTLLVICSAIWLLAVLGLFHILPLAGTFDLDLYRLFSVAAVLGWVSGNIYMARRRNLPPGTRWKKRVLMAYLLGPPGMVYLLRSMASTFEQQAAPFVPLYSLVVYVIFFLVPVTLRSTAPTRERS